MFDFLQLVILSFLTLAHIFDRVVEEFMLSVGGHIGYWQVGIASATAPSVEVVADFLHMVIFYSDHQAPNCMVFLA